jgi:hypothetical protein
MKRAWNFALIMWRPVLLLIAAACLLLIIFGFRLGSLNGGMSAAEAQTYQQSSSLSAIWDRPVNAPYKLVVYILSRVSIQTSVLRLASVGIGMATVVFFYLISRRLFRPLLALGITGLFATSSIVLQGSRSLTTDVMMLGLVFLLWLTFLFRYYRAHQFAWIIGSAVIGIMLYTPPISLFVLAAAIWQQKRIRQSFEQLKPATIAISTSIFFAFLLPMVISLVVEPALWRSYLGLPDHFAPLVSMAKALAYIPISLVALSPPDPLHWLGRQPVLDAAVAIPFIYGLITLIRNPKLDRLWALLAIFVLGSLWIALSDRHSNILLLIPFVYIVIGLGIQALLTLWFDTFPRNPLARWTGAVLMGIIIVFSLNFQILRYFVAWAHNPETRALYNQQIHK